MKKVLAMLLAVLALASIVACNTAANPVDDKVAEGKVLNIWCWNDEFQRRLTQDADGNGINFQFPADVTVNWIINPNDGGVYQKKLDEALFAQTYAAADEKIDLFLIEADYAAKYADSPYTLDVKKDIGLTDADLADMYSYTKDMVTYDGALKAVSWQACPAGFFYRTDYAKQYLGTDDAAEIQAMVATWDKFNETAAKLAENGIKMLSGFHDAYRVYAQNISPVDANGVIQVPAEVKAWIEDTKAFSDKGYNNKSNSLWDGATQGAGAKIDGKVFGYFGPSWYIDFSLKPWALDDANAPQEVGNGSFGLWHGTPGPNGGYFWGGTWLCAAAGTDNKQLIKDIMLAVCCNADNAEKLVDQVGEFVNNTKVISAKANDASFGNAFLGGQNHIAVYFDIANNLNVQPISIYTQYYTENIQSAMGTYFEGQCTLEEAYDNFFQAMKTKCPELVIPETY